MILRRRKPAPVVSLWAAVGPDDLQTLARTGWSAWPQRDAHDLAVEAFEVRDEAVHVVRDELVRDHGEGSLVVFDVPPSVTGWPGVERHGRRLLIPKGRRLTKAVVGDVTEEAQYRSGVEQAEVDAVRDHFGELVPDGWRAMVTAPSWLRRGWMTSGAYVDLHPPVDAVRATQVWHRDMVYHPGALVIGSDGGDRLLAIDLREGDPPVVLLDRSSTGWDDAVVQSPGVHHFAERLEHGDFAYTR